MSVGMGISKVYKVCMLISQNAKAKVMLDKITLIYVETTQIVL